MPNALNVATYPSSTAVTPSDATPIKCRALFSAGAGTLVIKHTAADSSKTFTVIAAPFILPVELDDGRVMAASTATGIVALS